MQSALYPARAARSATIEREGAIAKQILLEHSGPVALAEISSRVKVEPELTVMIVPTSAQAAAVANSASG